MGKEDLAKQFSCNRLIRNKHLTRQAIFCHPPTHLPGCKNKRVQSGGESPRDVVKGGPRKATTSTKRVTEVLHKCGSGMFEGNGERAIPVHFQPGMSQVHTSHLVTMRQQGGSRDSSSLRNTRTWEMLRRCEGTYPHSVMSRTAKASP